MLALLLARFLMGKRSFGIMFGREVYPQKLTCLFGNRPGMHSQPGDVSLPGTWNREIYVCCVVWHHRQATMLL
jgi:hypothetical protein